VAIDSGEFFGVIGANGSGKSTLLKVMAGIYPPDTGAVTVNGVLSPFIELGVGFNFELNARDNIRLTGTLLGLSGADIRERFDDILAFAELERFVDQKLKNYSSGMLLRLAYSIAIQVPFDILLLDEVLAVGDKNFQDKCFATFDAFREQGKTIVFVTHDLSSVTRFCDRVLLLESGQAIGVGSPDEIVDIYRDRENARQALRRGVARGVTVLRTAPSVVRGDGSSAEKLAAKRSAVAVATTPAMAPIDPVAEFHADHYVRHNQRRLEHLASLDLPLAGRSVLEVGAGIGDHTSFFLERGCSVLATDAREENLAVLRRRFPEIESLRLDLDWPEADFEATFDVVYCYSTLDHLSRPAEALEFLADRCRSLLLLEVCVSYGATESIHLVEEPVHHPSQSISGIGCRPTRSWVHAQLGRAFPHVYMPLTQPWHPEFPLDWTQAPATDLVRAVFVASRDALDNRLLATEIPTRQVRH
jgi:ABC-type polysaccharide/polyol phosphate transport system ATPase subunit/SAM-dependent methyltransferase